MIGGFLYTTRMRFTAFLPILIVAVFILGSASVNAQEVVFDQTTTVKARVVEILETGTRPIPGTGVESNFQVIRAEILEGDQTGTVVEIDNDFLNMRVGEKFFLVHTKDAISGADYYHVSDPYRLTPLLILAALFIGIVLFFGGKQGARGLLALMMSLFFIVVLLLPGVLKGYSPIWVSIGVASLIVLIGSYVTHGVNKMTTAAVLGMIATVLGTGALAHYSILFTRLSGYASDESIYLSFNVSGGIDLAGLLLGGILIGTLGVLYDAAIGQAVAVEELASAGAHLTRAEVYRRALRIGREHVGALVNTLAIAYVGASLPLLLLFYGFGSESLLVALNREIFATEIVRTLVGSIGLVLAVPITTVIAVRMLVSNERSV